MIYTDINLPDGLYNVKDGELFKYKAKGGSARVHEIKRLVRCKDCKWAKETRMKSIEGDVIVWKTCPSRTEVIEDDDFCSYGERSEE